ncbi:threonine/serine dehydratase [Pseudonocardia eucalypti]|uniref:Threonine/serine dehydratase n=1 Tax=Pseudonocardia eucalypti TaxID=648755 RepID=A0ABP9PQI2_9PSEU|nr:threonine dehydratase [Pseudonocardia eucalypti]
MRLVSVDEVRAAAERIRGVAVRTPLLACPWAERPERTLWLKPENLQPIGAFKVRGAWNALAVLPESERAAGVVAFSSGNHAQAVAYAARAGGVPAVIVIDDTAPALKIAATKELGAEVVLAPPAERAAVARALAAERGATLIPPYDHPNVIAGQGTAGLEIAEDRPDVASVLVPISGGGLASGIAVAVKALCPKAAVFGVEPELAADTRDSFKAGELVRWPSEDRVRTSADGLRAEPSELTFAHLTALLDDVLTVSEAEIRSTVGELAARSRIVAEPSGAVAPAAYLHRTDVLPPGPCVAVVSGGNIDPALFVDILRERTHS